jgi:radical SAM superfamily enzyme YgiQ (UPF0313 family)
VKNHIFGAESGNNAVLKQMDRGNTIRRSDTCICRTIEKFDIIPEYSFVLGTPAPSPEEVEAQIDFEINFIKEN